MIQSGEDLLNNILYLVPLRQFVFTIPILLRVCLKYYRKLLICELLVDASRIR
jgi:hypothetical protein